MRIKGNVTVERLLDLLKRSDFDLGLASDAAASLGLSTHLLERIARARYETAHALQAGEAVKAQDESRGMKEQEQRRESNGARDLKDPTRQSWYNVRRLAQRLQRHPEEASRIASQIISTANAEIDK